MLGLAVILTPGTGLLSAPQRELEPSGSKDWLDRREEIERLLRSAEVVSSERISQGVTEPRKLTLKLDDFRFHAIWKPISRGRHKGYWESFEAEIAAYEMDKLLGLDMVPPTVRRDIRFQSGSLQWWVEGAQLYEDVQDRTPSTSEWSHRLSRMEMFDVLIGNPDRNAGNFLVDSEWKIILIDHSRAFIDRKELPEDRQRLPEQFDRLLLPELEALDRELLERHFGNLLMGWQAEAVLARRDALLSYLDALIAERGEARVLF